MLRKIGVINKIVDSRCFAWSRGQSERVRTVPALRSLASKLHDHYQQLETGETHGGVTVGIW